MTTKLYTAAEARRIDIERGGEGVIGWDCLLPGHLWFPCKDNEYLFVSKEGDRLYPPFAIEERWLPLTPEPEQKPVVLDYLVLVDANERIKQLEKENESLLAERNRLREWYEDYYTKQPTIEHLQKELAEATQNYHEILADHGELTRKFDELTEKARWKSCKDEKPTKNAIIVYANQCGMFLGRGHYDLDECHWYLYTAIGFDVLCDNLEGLNVSWKYEADL